ncbi:MAG: GntR family transcriptional regulator [Oscillospiraceae bacterium]|nr:GntR family transcriptional regulator [Oscillospiraceae bacterium]
MVSFDSFVPSGGRPIYLQILYFIKRGAAAGTIRDGDELPSRRVLSSLLGINPNTVQKAFRMLEDEELISSHSGAKSFMTIDEEKLCQLRRELLAEDIRGIVMSLKQTGVSRAEALELINTYWEENEI